MALRVQNDESVQLMQKIYNFHMDKNTLNDLNCGAVGFITPSPGESLVGSRNSEDVSKAFSSPTQGRHAVSSDAYSCSSLRSAPYESDP